MSINLANDTFSFNAQGDGAHAGDRDHSDIRHVLSVDGGVFDLATGQLTACDGQISYRTPLTTDASANPLGDDDNRFQGQLFDEGGTSVGGVYYGTSSNADNAPVAGGAFVGAKNADVNK